MQEQKNQECTVYWEKGKDTKPIPKGATQRKRQTHNLLWMKKTGN